MSHLRKVSKKRTGRFDGSTGTVIILVYRKGLLCIAMMSVLHKMGYKQG